jgi:hypothetical protein
MAGALAAAFKLSLLRSQHIYALGGAVHDDRLFMKLAAHLVRGEWLGPYDQFTLAKGPVYSFFIAANFWVGTPLALMQQLLYVGACATVIWALAPVMKSGWARLLAFSFLVYNPLTYEGEAMTRILRQHLTVPLGVIVAAGVIALVLRRKESWGIRAPWAVGTGLALGLFWNTREEGIWIMPMIGMVGLALAIEAGRQGWRPLRAWGILAALVVFTAWIPTGVISALNAKHYGWFGAVEFRASEFKDAYGALTRVTVGPNLSLVPVSREARLAIYEVSPAFAELRPHLEDGGVAAKWMNHDLHPETEGQYLSGWFMWAFRDAVAASGHGATPQGFIDFCGRLADEVNRACDEGRIESTGSRSGFLSRWHPEYGARFKAEWRGYLHEALNKEGFETIVPSSDGTDDDIRYFVDLTYDNLSPSTRSTYFHKPDQIKLNVVKLNLLRDIADALRGKFYVVFCFAGLVVLARVVQLAVKREWSWVCWLALAVFGSALASITINFLVHIMAFDNVAPTAFVSAYPLVQLAAILVLFDGCSGWMGPLFQRLKLTEKITQWVTKKSAANAE